METISCDSELLTQYVAAVAVPNSRRFTAARDENGHLLLFSLGTDAKLHVSKLDASGHRVVRDFGLMLGLPDSYTAHAFEVVQGAGDHLYVAVAVAHGDENKSDLFLLRPFYPREVDLASQSASLRSLIIPETGEGDKTARVFSIIMAPSSAKQAYPPVLLTFRDTVYQSQDLASALVTKSGDKWSWVRKDNVQLPVNAHQIIALQPLLMKYGTAAVPGYAVLYTIQGQTALMFHSVNAPHKLEQKLPCPPEARAMAVRLNTDGYTDLLVGGSGLYCLKANKLAGPEFHEITRAGVFSDIQEIQITQNKSHASIWSANTSNGIGYLTTDGDLNKVSDPIQVIPDSQGGYFTPFKATATDTEKFVVSDTNGSLTLLELDASSGLWKPVPLVQPSLEKTLAFQAYMTHIKPSDAHGAPLVSHPVILKASGQVSITVNGRPILADEHGVKVMTDQTGALMLTVPTEDISTHTFTISDTVQGSGKEFPVDPSEKVYNKLSHIHHKEDLDITLPDNSKLLENSKLSGDELEQIARTISKVVERKRHIDNGQETPSQLAVCADDSEVIESLGIQEMAWEAWHWLERQGENILSVIMNGADFIVQIAKKTYRWVIKTAEQVWKALSFIFKKILEIGDKIIQWLGYIYSWKDIRATQESIVNIATDALEDGPAILKSLRAKTDTLFQTLQDVVSGKLPPKEQLDRIGVTANAETATQDVDKNRAEKSLAVNWAQYQFYHGGARDASTFLSTAPATQSEGAGKLEAELEKIRTRFEGKAQSTQESLVKEYDPEAKKSTSARSAFEKFGESFLGEIIGGVRTLADLLLELAETIVSKFKDVLTTPINVPVFSWLYKTFISGGEEELTILGAISLIIAIPTTILAKLITNAPPPSIPRGRLTSILKGMLDGKPTENDDFSKFSAICGLSTLNITMLVGLVTSFTSAGPSPVTFTEQDDSALTLLPTSPLLELASGSTAGGKKVTRGHFLDALVFFYQMVSIPKGTGKPGYTLKLSSWVVSVFNCVTTVTLHFVAALAEKAIEKVRGVIDGVLQAVVFSTSVAGSAIEIREQGWKGKDDTASGLDIASSTFVFIGVEAGALERLTDPSQIAKYAAIAKYTAFALAFIMTGTKVSIHVSKGNYTDIPFMGGS